MAREATKEKERPVQETISDAPPVGLIVVPGAGDHVAGAILRARSHGHDVLVTHFGTPEADGIEYAEQLDAHVVHPEREDPDTDYLRNTLSEVARTLSYPGLILQQNLEATVDFEASAKAIDTDHFAVRAQYSGEPPESMAAEVVVGIPAYNEEIAIGSIVQRAGQIADDVIVVDDGSTDRTPEIARTAGARVIQNDSNHGKGAAIQQLFDHVANRSFEVLVTIDGDGQHVPDQISTVAEPVLDGRADIAIGSRYQDSEGDDETPRYRRFGQQVLDTMLIGSSGQDLSDSQSGFRAFSPTAVADLELTTDGMGIESEIVDAAGRADMHIEEVPIDVRYEGVEGQTYHPVHHGLSVVTFILQMVRDRHPLVFFGIPGLILTLAGGLWGLDAILVYQSTGAFYPAKLLASGFLTIIGVLGVFVGLILNRISNMMAELDR